MAWSNVGPLITLEPGAAVTWTYVFSGTRDVGMQIADAYTGPHANPAVLGIAIAFDQGKSVEGINQAIYRVSIRNPSSTFVLHNLQGGGVT